MRTHNLMIIVLVSVAVIGCREDEADIANGDDPLRALTVTHKSERYTTSYWTQKSVSDTTLWADAVEYCEDKIEGDHPNCDAVRYVKMIERQTKLPEDRPDTFRLTVPQTITRDTASR
jgi:hypothetical protein